MSGILNKCGDSIVVCDKQTSRHFHNVSYSAFIATNVLELFSRANEAMTYESVSDVLIVF